MAESQSSAPSDDRTPRLLHVSRSFTRMGSPSSPGHVRKRSSTVQETGFSAIPETRNADVSPDPVANQSKTDVFEKYDESEQADGDGQSNGPELQLPSNFDELPIEIRSLTERFLESLSAKVHPTPLNADSLSELFQDFYERAASHIATHIASLSSRIGRDRPQPSLGNGRGSARGRTRAGSGAKGSSDNLSGHVGGEMLTATEFADRKKARRLLEFKRIALEEAVERTVCEKVYGKIWKHKSTDDDARDEKLRSRAAALAVVGIGLKELRTDQSPSQEDVRKMTTEREEEISQSLAAARQSLQQMDSIHFPLGKLQCLTAAHKSIVETLSQFFPSSSSADEVLPTLIYTLITSPPEGVHAISNLNFIQRFRATGKVGGEAAYCLVNLEAAISFLETVDLSSLRADELPQGPPKSTSRPSTPTSEKPLTLSNPTISRTLTPGLTPVNVTATDRSNTPKSASTAPQSPGGSKSATRPQNPRRLSSLMQAQADRIEAGRENFLSAADRVYDSINGTLDNSLQFIFGRFKEQVAEGESRLPKTLEDARRLISPRPAPEDEDHLSASGRSSPAIDDPLNASSRTDSKLLEMLGGRKPPRDRSADSSRSGASGNRHMPFAAVVDKPKEDAQAPYGGNLFASINPLNRFGMPQIPSFSRFGRVATPPTSNPATPGVPPDRPKQMNEQATSSSIARNADAPTTVPEADRAKDNVTSFDDMNAREALAELRKIKPPRRRFIEVESANELKVGEIEELLLEYRRLAKAIGEAIAT